MSISAPFIARPIATSLLAVALLLAGLLGYNALPVSALPQVDFPTIQVTTELPGASPETIATLITASLERQFGEIQGLSSMTSTSAEGTSEITLQFDLSRNIDSAAQDVQAAINAAAGTLPTNLPYPPTYSKVNPADAPVLTLALTSETVPIAQIGDAADTLLQPKLSQIAGVGKVTVQGGIRPAIRVQIDPARLAAYGLGLEDVRSAVADANVNGAKGGFDGPRLATALGANDQITSPAQYANLIIAWRNQAPVRIRDVGQVVGGVENDRVGAWYFPPPAAGKRAAMTQAVILDIQRQPGANIVETVATIKRQLPQLQRAMPAGIKLTIVADRTDTIRASVADVQVTLVLAVILVTLVIYLFLGSIRATIIPALALPLSLIGTFGVMALLGIGLDNLSLMALTVATGFVVDDAIVMIENVVRYIEMGERPLVAAYKGARQIGFTIVSLTVSLIAVFIPLLFMTGVVGRLFSAFAITLSVAVIVSALVSLTLTPMMCGRLLRPAEQVHPGRLARAFEAGFNRSLAFYRRSLHWSLRHDGLVLLIAAATLVGTVLLYMVIPKGFLPQQDTGIVTAVIQASQTASIPRMSRLQAQVGGIIQADPAVAGITSFVGAGTINATPNVGQFTIALKPIGQRAPVAAVIDRLDAAIERIPGVTVFMQPVQDIQIGTRVSRTQFQYTLVDTSATELDTWAPRLVAALQKLPELRDVASDQQDEGLQTYIDVNRDAAMRLGVPMQAIEDTLYDAFGQRQISTIFAESNQYRVILEADLAFQANPGSLSQLYVSGTASSASTSSNQSSTGNGPNTNTTANTGNTTNPSTAASLTSTATNAPEPEVPLTGIATVTRRVAPLAITHQSQFPSVTLSFDLAPGASLGDAVTAVRQAERSLGMPDTISGLYSGDAAEFQRSLASEPWLILAAVVVIYIVLGVLYESTIHPVTILSTLPSAGIGALLALMLTGQDLSLVALVGIVLLMGIVKKNAIMMIDFAIEAQRDRALSPDAAIEEASLLRFRPIMMTTAAALLGAVPLVIEGGAGSELRYPLGIAIIGGLLLSQLLTLYTTPAIYLAFERLRLRFAPRPDAQAAPAE
ncbi:MAG TPA: efflux RND transporter permease subunit [Acetobacteraceae bacterium]|nr:efflux RND transporter permease subunit [Acetobacteraceae bacterium]